jgi:hypothetical protein
MRKGSYFFLFPLYDLTANTRGIYVYLLHEVFSMNCNHICVSYVAVFVCEQCVFNYMRNFNFLKLNVVVLKF